MGLTDRPEDAVGCYDAVGRWRQLKLTRSARGVTIVAPPGEVADVGLAELDELRVCLARLAAAGARSASDRDR
ncbi:MAG: hypothetical protein H0W01_06475 [Pseudonocardiales bacterium]|nr:hypothetical protein [Pseudonocardiales bacterium]